MIRTDANCYECGLLEMRLQAIHREFGGPYEAFCREKSWETLRMPACLTPDRASVFLKHRGDPRITKVPIKDCPRIVAIGFDRP